MKSLKKLFLLCCTVLTIVATAGCGGAATSSTPKDAFELFPTQNYWTFLKLDTSTGEIWQVHFSVDDDNAKGTIPLNTVPLAEGGEAGRFTLYPTKNMYNFILLDQRDGRTWQIQWSFDEKTRGVVASLDK